MIVTATPGIKQIIREVWKPLALLFVWDVIVTVTYFLMPFTAPSLPLTLFGSALVLFLGFRSNSAYQRWWEGRGLWGLMINASRNLARQARNFLPEEARTEKRGLVKRQIAYVHALRCQLRRQKPDSDVARFLSKGDADLALARVNVANGILDGTGRRIDEARQRGWIDTIQQAAMEAVLVDIANAQGGMERLKNTPLPVQYRFFPTLFTHLMCILLPIGLVETMGLATPLGSTLAGLMFLAVLAIGDDLVDPFDNSPHDLPLSAMCRTIEIDLLQAIGDDAPPPMRPDKEGILW
ncbi:bestrophin family protein [Sphingobium sp. KCTC 72723]|uniref:bestrophin family protein n=1 Tax=Sphingobium sp. KCTC 72723 TaxID=2733867 RepID=UPI00165D450F|nr:bestrophin family ion channel [Sphingobium sp. KCTC 72723]